MIWRKTPEAALRKQSFISIIDDDQSVRESLRRLLRSLGYTAEAFPSAADFLASPRLDETACLIADIHMPGMTGIELYSHLVGAGRAIPTILVTAYPNDAARTRTSKEGVVGYLCKPLDEHDLMQCLRSALDHGTRDDGKP